MMANNVEKSNDLPQHSLRYSDIAGEPQKMLMPIEGYEKMPLVPIEEAIEPLVTILPDIRRKTWIAKAHVGEAPADELSIDESASICLYSMEWEPRDECLYHRLNTTLRDKNRERLKPWFLYLKLILTALTKIPSIQGRTVYRGIKLDLHENYPENKTFVWWGFSSCTSSVKVLQSEQFLGKIGMRTMFNIQCDTGKDIRRHSFYEREDEVLLLPATNFQVVSCLQLASDLYVIQLKEMTPPYPLLQPICVSETRLSNVKDSLVNEKTPSTYCNSSLEALIAECPPRSTVDLRDQHLTDQDMSIVVKQAIFSKECIELNLSNNKITSIGAALLADALHNITKLKILHLYQTNLTDINVQILAKSLSENISNLSILGLDWNKITDDGVQHLANMLKTNMKLIVLGLSNNLIGDRGVQMLANTLTHQNNTLEELSLNGNSSVSDASIKSLIEMLKHNRSLKKICVNDCNLSKKGKSKLSEIAESKKAIFLVV